MARPTPKNRKPAQMTRLLQVRIDDKTGRLLTRAAELTGLTESEYVRITLRRAATRLCSKKIPGVLI